MNTDGDRYQNGLLKVEVDGDALGSAIESLEKMVLLGPTADDCL